MSSKSGSLFLILGVLVVAVIIIGIFVMVSQKSGDEVNKRFDSQLKEAKVNDLGGISLLPYNNKEFVGGKYSVDKPEYVQTYDLAPIFEKYGLDRKYTLSMDIKSKDVSKTQKMLVYMQNGSSTKYTFVYQQVSPVSTEYKRFTFKGLSPKLSTSTDSKAMLSLYGDYGTGNIPVVRNIRLELEPK